MGSRFYSLKAVTYLAVNQRTGRSYKVAADTQQLALHQLLRNVPAGEAYDWALYRMCGCGKPLGEQRYCSTACAEAGNDGTQTNLVRKRKVA